MQLRTARRCLSTLRASARGQNVNLQATTHRRCFVSAFSVHAAWRAHHWTTDSFVQFCLRVDSQDTGNDYGSTEPEWPGRVQVAYLVTEHNDQLLGASVFSRRSGEDWLHRMFMKSSVPLGELREGITLKDLFNQFRCDPSEDENRDLHCDITASSCQARFRLDKTMVSKNLRRLDDPMRHEAVPDLTLDAGKFHSHGRSQRHGDRGAHLVSQAFLTGFCLPRTTDSRRGYRGHFRVDEEEPKIPLTHGPMNPTIAHGTSMIY